jgi:hypothetical protein
MASLECVLNMPEPGPKLKALQKKLSDRAYKRLKAQDPDLYTKAITAAVALQASYRLPPQLASQIEYNMVMLVCDALKIDVLSENE